jgi:CDP-diacylglycerol--glycerol-3-phosphate 3-phosphatidyltransferase
MRRLPNLLSVFRLVAAPALLGLAWLGQGQAFLILLVASLLSDAVDGLLARRFELVSPLGAKLDSWGDLAIYSTLPLCVWWLWPEVIASQFGYVVAVLAAFCLPIAVGLAKFRRLTSYHTWGAKASAVLMGGALLVLFSGGPDWPFHVATVVLVAEALEEIAITFVLPRWTSDVPTLWHARRIAAEAV